MPREAVSLLERKSKPFMGNRLYVGNLPFTTTELELKDMFAQAGAVTEVLLMQDKFTGKSRGFAFVTMASETDAQNAVSQPVLCVSARVCFPDIPPLEIAKSLFGATSLKSDTCSE